MKHTTNVIDLFPRHLIESLGKKLATLTQKNHDFQSFTQSQTFQRVDLSKFNAEAITNKNAFHQHIPKLSKRLFGGTKFNEFSSLASHVIPPETLEKFSDKSFLQIAKLAQRWADADLRRDTRFNGKNSDLTERHALAQAIAHQNRALVAVGSVSNLAGLVGILADTVWLLIVALRSIFQIASIYDKPLTGKAGIQIAYEILSRADLSKLQEKQTLLAGIGVVEAIVDKNVVSDESSDLQQNDYKKLTKFADETESEQTSMLVNTMNYMQQLAVLAQKLNVNLQGINLGKLNKVLPITAVGIGASYNNLIIDEILNIAMATFSPPPKLANIEKIGYQDNFTLALDDEKT